MAEPAQPATAAPAPAPQPPQPKAPTEVYAVFCNLISQDAAHKVVNSLTNAMGMGVKHIHLLFQTTGGYVGDGVFLYNFFRAIPIELTLYNAGQISSVGVIAYLGAKHRITAKSASFMFHRATNSPQFADAAKLRQTAESLILDDERMQAIVKEHAKFPPEFWTKLGAGHDVYFTGEESVKFGVAHKIGEFGPPRDVQVYNLHA